MKRKQEEELKNKGDEDQRRLWEEEQRSQVEEEMQKERPKQHVNAGQVMANTSAYLQLHSPNIGSSTNLPVVQ